MVVPAPALVVGFFAWRMDADLEGASTGLLTATSILTGFTFSMAVVFWNKSIDTRRDPRWMSDGDALEVIDRIRTHLVFTVFMGVAAVFVITLYTIFGAVLGGNARILVCLASALVIYVITLVTVGLKLFNQAFFILKR